MSITESNICIMEEIIHLIRTSATACNGWIKAVVLEAMEPNIW